MAKKSSRPATSTAPVAPAANETPAATATQDAPAPSTLATDGTVQSPAPVSLANQLIALHGDLSALVARLNECKTTDELAETQKAIFDCEGNIEAKRKEIEAEKEEAARIARIDDLYVYFASEVGTRENKFAPLAKLSNADAWEMLTKWSRLVNSERMDKPDFSKLPGCTTPDDATDEQKKGAKVARACALQRVQDFNKPTLGLFRLNTDARASRFAGETTEKRTERVLKSGKVIIGQNIRTAYEVPSACGYAFTTRG